VIQWACSSEAIAVNAGKSMIQKVMITATVITSAIATDARQTKIPIREFSA
jgi:hypothetical protein